MKKKVCLSAALFAAAAVLAGCGDKEFLKDMKAASYVTLGEYKGIEASAQAPSVPDSDVDYYIRVRYLEPNAVSKEVTGRAVREGDTANIDFAGYQDGAAFEGGTGSADLTIGSGQFIPGFEEGLVGVNIGETVSLNLTFPDPYQNNPDLAGAPVVFEVTVNSISEQALPALTDEFVQSLGVENCQTAQELWDRVYDMYYQEAQAVYDSEIETIMSDKIMAGCTFKKDPPKGLVNRFAKSVEVVMTRQAGKAGMQLKDYMQLTQGLDEEGYRAMFQETATELAQRYIMYQAIADVEGLTPGEEEIQQEIDSMVEIYGYASEEELLQQADRDGIGEDLMRKKVVAFLKENGNITAEQTIAD